MSESPTDPKMLANNQARHNLAPAGNNPLEVLSEACHHKLALKAITGVSSVVASVAIYHQAAFMLEWYTTAEAAGVYSAHIDNATVLPFITPEWFGGDKTGFLSVSCTLLGCLALCSIMCILQSGMWWWTTLDYLLSGLNMITVFILPWIVFNDWRVLRWSTLGVLVACSLLVNLTVGAFRQASVSAGLADGRKWWGTMTLALVWVAQVLAASAAPWLLGGALHGFLRVPGRVQLAYTAGTVCFSFVLLSVLAPAFGGATPLVQVLLRVFVYTAIFEATVTGVRVCTRINFTDSFPRDNIVALLSPLIIVSGLVGRILSTSMDTLGETIGVAVALSAMEVLLRLTLPSRDRVLVSWCTRWCHCCWRSGALRADVGFQTDQRSDADLAPDLSTPPAAFAVPVSATHTPSSTSLARATSAMSAESTASVTCDDVVSSIQQAQLSTLRARAAREAQDIHAYFSLLTLDTMSEDIGILLSLPFALIMRLPPRVGGQPLGVLDVLARVGGQYALELLTDLAPALLMVCVNVCCGVRWRRVGGGAVRGAVLRQLAAEAAGEDKAVEREKASASSTNSTKGQSAVVLDVVAQSLDDTSSAALPLQVTSKEKQSHTFGSSASSACSDEAMPAPLVSSTLADAEAAEHKASALEGEDPGGMAASSTPSQALSGSVMGAPAAAGSSKAYNSSVHVPEVGADSAAAVLEADTSPSSASEPGRCNCVLRTEDPDVARHRRHLARVFKRSIRRVTDDATWQPLEWQGMLRLAVEGSSGDGDEAPARVLWRDVRRVEDMSAMQLLVARVSVTSEVWAVRMGRAWEGRFRGWNVLFFVGVFSAALLAGRNLAGAFSRCMLRDSDGDAYFDFCPEV